MTMELVFETLDGCTNRCTVDICNVILFCTAENKCTMAFNSVNYGLKISRETYDRLRDQMISAIKSPCAHD